MKRIFNFLLFIALFVAPLIFFTDLTRNPYYFQIVLVNGLTVILWMLWLYAGLREQTVRIRPTPLDLPLWSFFAVATLSWLVMLFGNLHEPYLSYGIFSEGYKRWLFLLVNSLMVYYGALHFVNDENRDRIILTVFWAGWLAAAYGILQYFGIEFFWPKVLNPFGGRSVSTFGNPNFLSSYLVLLIPVLFFYYLRATSAGKRLFYLFFLLTYFIALLCTLTRSSWGGLVVAMAIVLILLWSRMRDLFRKQRKLILAPFAIFVFLIVFMPRSDVGGYNPSVIQRLAEAKEATKTYYGSWHQRRLIWSCAWHMIIEKPVLGKGWGCFELFYPSYQGRHLFLPAYHPFRTHANNAHNELLEIWSQTGTIGFGIYLWLLAVIVSYSLFLIKNLKDEKKFLAIGLFASLAGMWVDNLMNVSLHFAIPGFLYWWNMGLLAGLGRDEIKEVKLNSFTRKAAAWFLILLGALLVMRYSRNFLGEIHYFNGFKASKRNDLPRAIPELERAHELQRFEVNNNYELANSYARSGSRDKAIPMYKEALRANAGYDEIYFNMATVLMQGGQVGPAVDEYNRSLYINPLSLEAYAALGSVFLQSPERYGKAGIELFTQCLYFYPSNKDVWNNLGFLYTKTNRNEEALTAYRKALEIAPDFELAQKNYRVALARLGKTDDTFARMDALYRQVEGSVAAKNWSAALTASESLVKMAPRSFKARLYLANIYFTVGRVPEAIVQYGEALKFEPNNLSALGNLGLALFQTRQYAAAAEQFQRILQLDPNNAFARQRLEQINAFLSTQNPSQNMYR
jgi:tetratricopeptide (TPR) repeat protein